MPILTCTMLILKYGLNSLKIVRFLVRTVSQLSNNQLKRHANARKRSTIDF